MTTKTAPNVKLPTDTRGDNWAYEAAQRMHAAHAAKADRTTEITVMKLSAKQEKQSRNAQFKQNRTA